MKHVNPQTYFNYGRNIKIPSLSSVLDAPFDCNLWQQTQLKGNKGNLTIQGRSLTLFYKIIMIFNICTGFLTPVSMDGLLSSLAMWKKVLSYPIISYNLDVDTVIRSHPVGYISVTNWFPRLYSRGSSGY